MIKRIRIWLYIIFMASFAALGVIESTVVKSSVLLFDHVPIPAITKYVLPILTITFFLGWLFLTLARLGLVLDAEEKEDEPKAREIITKIILEIPTVCTVYSLIALYLLEAMQDSLIAWQHARNIYSYGLLWIVFAPCLHFVLEFFQSIKGFSEFDMETNTILKKYQMIDGLVCSLIGIANLYLLMSIANMSVCSYIYILFGVIVIYRLFRYYHLTTMLWTIKENREISETDKKEGIL